MGWMSSKLDYMGNDNLTSYLLLFYYSYDFYFEKCHGQFYILNVYFLFLIIIFSS